jgi:hypothetical protein
VSTLLITQWCIKITNTIAQKLVQRVTKPLRDVLALIMGVDVKKNSLLLE